jgi:hypothetical protein
MTAPARLRRLALAGVRVELAGGSLRLDAPPGALSREDVEALRADKPALAAAIAAADSAHADAMALLDRLAALVRSRRAPDDQRPARLAVLAVYRDVVSGCRQTFDPLLPDSADAVRALAARWGFTIEGIPHAHAVRQVSG